MIHVILGLLLTTLTFAQTPMDRERWYLDPHGQEILISIDDLHDETIQASPSMDWGRKLVPTLKLKKEIVIAIIDGGIEIEHPELKNHIAYNSAECFNGTIIPPKDEEDKDGNGLKGDCAGWDFTQNHNRPEDEDGHGTHVTGIINSVMSGVQGSFKFLPIKAFAADEGRGNTTVSSPLPTRLTKAFEYAMSRDVDVIHLSVGWPKSYMTVDLDEAIKKALKKGILVVAASGNSSQRATIYPCQMEGVICVGALRPNGDVARFSNWGSQVDVYAPGEKILSTIPHTLPPLYISRKGYDFKNGTSQAAPFISGALGLLKGLYPEESTQALYSRLMLGASSAPDGLGLKGLFHLAGSVDLKPRSFIFPNFKGLHSLVLDGSGNFKLSLPFKNFWKNAASPSKGNLVCAGVSFGKASFSLKALKSEEEAIVNFSGRLNSRPSLLDCSLTINGEVLSLKLKVLEVLPSAFNERLVQQDEVLVSQSRSGTRSRFITMNTLKGSLPQALYYVNRSKETVVYHEDQKIGALKISEGCQFLRVWQMDSDKDGFQELLLESMCNKTSLKYQFLNLKLEEMYPAVTFKPSLTIVNYEEFQIIPQKESPPIFKFLSTGLVPPSESPWESNISVKGNHLYELYPVKETDGSFRFNTRIVENPSLWAKSLNLRYLPDYDVLHLIEGRLLVKMGQKTAWVNLETQTAVWANLDDLMLVGSRKQKLLGTDKDILQSFLTAYEYRGFMLNGVKLRYNQEDRFDPLIDVLGTKKNDLGYLTVLRTFQKLNFIQYDDQGRFLSKKEATVDRFDFLTAQDLISSVINLFHNGKMVQVVDGTKLNTHHVDVIKEGAQTSFEIPEDCVTQSPVVMEDKLTLPVFCALSKDEFVMKFIGL